MFQSFQADEGIYINPINGLEQWMSRIQYNDLKQQKANTKANTIADIKSNKEKTKMALYAEVEILI